MKWMSLLILLITGTAQAQVWTCEMQPRVLGEPRHGETVTHTFTKPEPDENGYVFVMENFTTDLEYNVEWVVLRENEILVELMQLRPHPTEVEQAVLFKKDRRAVKTLLMADVPAVLADQGYCEISEPAKES